MSHFLETSTAVSLQFSPYERWRQYKSIPFYKRPFYPAPEFSLAEKFEIAQMVKAEKKTKQQERFKRKIDKGVLLVLRSFIKEIEKGKSDLFSCPVHDNALRKAIVSTLNEEGLDACLRLHSFNKIKTDVYSGNIKKIEELYIKYDNKIENQNILSEWFFRFCEWVAQ